ncbi:MAG: hypothetical protein IJZ16_13335 [Clostridia bacterium]|nr:hypothetical protein [Clostridia bacterium]
MKVISKIIQWFCAVFLVMMALASGSVASGIIIFIAALLMAPIKPIRQFLSKIKIKSFIAIILSIILFFIGIAVSPSMDTSSDADVEDNLVIEDSTILNVNDNIVESTKESMIESTAEETDSIIETTKEDLTEKDTTETTLESTTNNIETTTRKESTTKQKETTTKQIEKTTNKVETTTKRVTTTVDPDSQVTVYVTETGKRYHYENPCGNGTYYPSTLANAKARGLTPCNKCVLH